MSLEDRLESLVGENQAFIIQNTVDEAVHHGLFHGNLYQAFQETIKDSRLTDENPDYFYKMNNFLLDYFNSMEESGMDEYNAKKIAYHDSLMQHFVNIAEEYDVDEDDINIIW